MEKVYKFIRLFFLFVKYNWKSRRSYQKDFILGGCVIFFSMILQILSLKVMFGHFRRIADWDHLEMRLLFSVYSINLNLFEFFFGNFRSLKKYIFNGELELMLSKPVSPMLHIPFRELSVQPLVGIFFSVILFVFCLIRRHQGLTPMLFVNAGVYSLLGIAVLYSLTLIAESVLFYTGYYYTPYDTLLDVVSVSQYPLSIFSRIWQVIFGALLPISLVGATPAAMLLEKETFLFSPVSLISPAVLLVFSVFFFKKSLRRYDGVGT